jgi:hypothetical protein
MHGVEPQRVQLLMGRIECEDTCLWIAPAQPRNHVQSGLFGGRVSDDEEIHRGQEWQYGFRGLVAYGRCHGVTLASQQIGARDKVFLTIGDLEYTLAVSHRHPLRATSSRVLEGLPCARFPTVKRMER